MLMNNINTRNTVLLGHPPSPITICSSSEARTIMVLALDRWWGPWLILEGTGQRTRRIVLAAVFPTSVDTNHHG